MITISQLLAIDAGGTSTRAMVMSPDGRCRGVGRGGRGNPVSDGAASAADAIAGAATEALRAAGASGEAVTAVTVAMAGGSLTPVADWLSPRLAAADVRAPVTIEPDLLAMFGTGTPEPDGYGLVAGTGATAVRVRGGEVDATADGLGWLLGDTGSGFWIGHRVARAVAAHLDGSGPATSLTPRVLEHLGIDLPDPADGAGRQGSRPGALSRLVGAVYASSPLRLAALAPLAFADPQDPVAEQLVTEAVRALAATVLGVAVVGLTGPLVVGGGLATQPRVRDGVVAQLAAAGLTGPVRFVEDGLVGAGVLALRRQGLIVDRGVFDRLSVTTAEQRARPR